MSDIQFFPNNFLQSGYEEISSWSPQYYQRIKEMDANFRFAGKITDEEALALEEMCGNMFVDTMTEEMLDRLEEYYYLTGNHDKPIDDRRRLLKAAFLGSGKISTEKIARIIRVYAECESSFEFYHELIITLLESNKIINFEDFTDIIGRSLPAHIKWRLIQETFINQVLYAGLGLFRTYIAHDIEDGGTRTGETLRMGLHAGAKGVITYHLTINDGGNRDGEVNGSTFSGIGKRQVVRATIQ